MQLFFDACQAQYRYSQFTNVTDRHGYWNTMQYTIVHSTVKMKVPVVLCLILYCFTLFCIEIIYFFLTGLCSV